MEQNAKNMVFSAFASDSLALGAHWIYDTEIIKSEFGEIDKLIKPLEGSFHEGKEGGDFTHYGDQTLLLLESIAEFNGFAPRLFAESWFKFMETYEGYKDHATIDTVDNHKNGSAVESSGSSSTDLGGASRIAPVVFLFRDDPEMAARGAREQTALTHNNPMVLGAAEFFARVALETLRGVHPVTALQKISADHFEETEIHKWVGLGIESVSADTLETILRFGQMCDINASFPSVIHIIAKYENDLKKALTEDVMCGGDSAARGMIVGMVLGAHHGSKRLPEEWISGMRGYERIRSALQRIEGLNP
jgi:ADP-ribosylglycohydrolase